MPPSTSFRNGALSIIEADRNLYNGEHLTFIYNVFYRHGILTQGDCRSNGPFINMYIPTFSEVEGNGDDTADLGEIYKLNMSFYNTGNEDSGKVYIKVTPISNGINMLNDEVSLDNLPSGGAIIPVNEPIVFEIGKNFICGKKAKFKIDVYNSDLEFIFNAELQVGNITSTDLFFDDFESGGNPEWSTSIGSGFQSYGWKIMETPYNHSQTHSFYAFDPPILQDSYLTLGPITLSTGKLYYLHFFHTYQFEFLEDGGVVEISTDNGNTFTDLGNYFIQNGYKIKIVRNEDIPSSAIAGRMAFSGGTLSTHLKESIVDLSDFAGKTIYIRFRAAANGSNGGNGWYIDDVKIEEVDPTCQIVSVKGDLNGDGVVDSSDLIILKNELIGNIKVTNFLEDVSDINGDSKINLLDFITFLYQISQ